MWFAVIAAASAIPLASTASTPRPAALGSCTNLLFSPAFSTDGSAYCVGLDGGGKGSTLRLYVTRDHGRSWTTTVPGGAALTSTGTVDDAMISPDFSFDKLIVVKADSLDAYYSTDAGATFDPLPLASVLGAGRMALLPGVSTPIDLPGASPHALVMNAIPGAMAGQNKSYLFDPVVPSVRLVAGTSEFDQGYFPSPTYANDHVLLAAAHSGGSPAADHADFFSCDLTMTCTTKLGSLPAGYSWVDQVRFAADYAHSQTLIVSAATASNRYNVFVSVDGGKHFAPVSTLSRALGELYGAGTQPFVALTAGPAGSRLLYARVSGGVGGQGPPSERLYTSRDGGRTWRLTAFGRAVLAPGSRGTMPYGYLHSGLWQSPTPSGMLTYANARLWMTADWWPRASSTPFVTAWCSADGGLRWKDPCS